jgi:hypothetical protein
VHKIIIIELLSSTTFLQRCIANITYVCILNYWNDEVENMTRVRLRYDLYPDWCNISLIHYPTFHQITLHNTPVFHSIPSCYHYLQ